MAGNKAPRVHLAGDVRGNIIQLLKRVNGVNKSNGPFDFLFCLGPFFAQGSDASLAVSELADFLDGKQKFVVTTYFLADESEECRKAVADARGRGGAVERLVGSKSAIDVEICENLHCLIGAGIHNLKGLRLAYVAGSYDALSFFEPISDDDLAAGADSALTFVQRTSMVVSHGHWGDAANPLDANLQKHLVDAWPCRCKHKEKEKSFYKDMNVVYSVFFSARPTVH